MTDEDDRMNRAKRIREMREGNRDGDDAGNETADREKAEKEATAEETGESESADEEQTTDDEDEKQTMEELVEEAAKSASEEDESGLEETVADDGELETMETEQPSSESEDVEEAEPVPATDGSSEQVPETDGSSTGENTSEDTEDEAETTDDEDGISAPLPDTDTLESALDDSDSAEVTGEDDEAVPAPATEVGDEDETTEKEDETRVLEFTLDDENYCLDIAYIEEIVKQETITRVPNTPEFVEGVVDLRGQITTILNPKVTLEKENTDADELIVVFDSEAFEDQGHIGWVVDDVRQVSPIVESEVNDPPMEADYINGVIDRDDDEEFVIWTSPELALETAE